MKIFRDLLVNKEDASVYITGIAYDKGASLGRGAKYAPEVIRELSQYLPPFSMDGYCLKDIRLFDNNIIKPTNLDNIKVLTKELFRNDVFNIFIGGDHSVSIPLQQNFYDIVKRNQKAPVIIHLDAHPDFCDYYDGSRFSHACPNMRAYEYGYPLESITLVGIRGYEEQEVLFFKEHPEIKIYQSSYILENGIQKMLEEIIEKYSDEKYEIYLSYDIDINDPAYASGTGTPEAFGPSAYDVMKIVTTLISKLNVKVLDIVEVSPKLEDNNHTTSWLAVKTLYEIFKVLIEKRK